MATVLASGPAQPPQPRGHRVTTYWHVIVLVLGVVSLGWLLRTQRVAQPEELLGRVGWWGAVVIGLDLAALSMDAAALHAFMRPEARMVSYWRVFGAQASGRAINVLTPGGVLGEATKVTLLASRAPRARVLSSLALVYLSRAYLNVAVIVVGVPLTLLLVDLPGDVEVAVGVALAVLVPAVVGLGVLVHRGAGASVVAVIGRITHLSPERTARWKARVAESDQHLRELHRDRSAGTWRGVLWIGASKLTSWTAALLLLSVIGVRLTPTVVIGVLSVGVLIGWIAAIVPMGLGVQDGGNYVLYGMLGATGAQGITVAMLGRGRSLTIAVLGLVALAVLQIVDRVALAGMRRRLRELHARHTPP